jgi:two-component system phosphate regulon response regulator PhoB
VHKRILIVEDEASIREMVAFALRKALMEVHFASDANVALAAIANTTYDLILLDWMLPGMSGLELARRLRREARTSEVPIIMLTARGDESDRVRGLEAGVDDYVVKPFSTRELVARIKAVMRRSHSDDGAGSIQIDELRIDGPAHRVFAESDEVIVGPTEYRLLYFFMTHAERVHSRAQMLDRIWGGAASIDERAVDVHVLRLRKLLEPFGLDDLIQTVRGAGYRFSTKRWAAIWLAESVWRQLCMMCKSWQARSPMQYFRLIIANAWGGAIPTSFNGVKFRWSRPAGPDPTQTCHTALSAQVSTGQPATAGSRDRSRRCHVGCPDRTMDVWAAGSHAKRDPRQAAGSRKNGPGVLRGTRLSTLDCERTCGAFAHGIRSNHLRNRRFRRVGYVVP